MKPLGPLGTFMVFKSISIKFRFNFGSFLAQKIGRLLVPKELKKLVDNWNFFFSKVENLEIFEKKLFSIYNRNPIKM